MALYHHFANKEEILDGIIDLVFSEIDLPPADGDWRAAIRHRAIAARRVLSTSPLGHSTHGVTNQPRA